MFKKMMTRAMLSRQLKHMPKEMQDQVLEMVEANPQFFENMAKEIKERTKKGQDQMAATQAVAMEHQAELQRMLQGKQ